MLYPKKQLMNIGKENIGVNVFNGVYWYHILNNRKDQLAEVNLMRQAIIQAREKESNIFSSVKTPQARTIVINRSIYNLVANSIFQDVNQKNKVKVGNIDIETIRKQELKAFVNYIKSIPLNTNQVDVMLYKTSGERLKTIYFTDKKHHYKKKMYGFYLVKEDIEEANLMLADSNRRINNIQCKELFDVSSGIRFTLDLDDAIVIEKE